MKQEKNYVSYVPGDKCSVTTNVTGTCKQLEDCPRAVLEKTLNRTLLYCSNGKDFNPLVCCPNVGDISEQKCVEYGRTIEVYNASSNFKKRKSKTSLNNVGVQDADPGEFPHMALIGFGNEEEKKWVCGGSLISSQYVLTAAHCAFYKQYTTFVNWVRLGEHDQTQETSNRIDYKIKEFIKHPLYKRPIKYNDIALILLEEKVTFSENIWPACVNTLPIVTNRQFIETGWGGEYLANILHKAKLEEFSKNDCQEIYSNKRFLKFLPNGITDSLICFGEKRKGQDACGGDSGGPLQIYHHKIYYMQSIVGIISFGRTYCAQPGIPDVYTKVSDYLEWIENIVWI